MNHFYFTFGFRTKPVYCGKLHGGKHSLAYFRLIHKNSWSKGLNEMHALPIVVTKDPYSWIESLCWNTWYGDYIEAKYPRLSVRFEDLLYHTEMVITQACCCFGGKLINESYFTYHVVLEVPVLHVGLLVLMRLIICLVGLIICLVGLIICLVGLIICLVGLAVGPVGLNYSSKRKQWKSISGYCIIEIYR